MRESEVARIRSNRDELKAEISELKAKDSDKMHALSEVKTLAEARKSRLQAYASELRRLRIGQAGDRGDLEGVQLRVRHAEAAAAAADEMEEGEVEIGEDEVAKDLQKRLTKAEELLLALGEQLRAYAAASSSASSASASASSSSGGGGGLSGPNVQALIESETRARSDLVEARRRVEKLEAILGPGGRADVREMADRLEEKARELKAAEAKATSQEAVSPVFLCF
jgi:E3 ubiquitin-protein ligase BRE1